jgi:hypothetical protein
VTQGVPLLLPAVRPLLLLRLLNWHNVGLLHLLLRQVP